MAFYIDSSGEVVESDATPEMAAFNGYNVATPEQVDAAKRQAAREAEFSTLPQQALGSAEALLRGGSLNFSDPLAVALGADPERMAARRESLGGAATALEMGGALLPIVASGGAAAAPAAGVRGILQGAARAMPKATAVISSFSTSSARPASSFQPWFHISRPPTILAAGTRTSSK